MDTTILASERPMKFNYELDVNSRIDVLKYLLVSYVSSFVVFAVCFCPEGLETSNMCALERSFISVNSHVDFQVSFLVK